MKKKVFSLIAVLALATAAIPKESERITKPVAHQAGVINETPQAYKELAHSLDTLSQMVNKLR